jgi:hypothetical protein
VCFAHGVALRRHSSPHSAFLDETRNEAGEPVQHELIVRKDLLDDSNAAKEPVRSGAIAV